MRVDPESGWLAEARRMPSPNRDARPGGVEPDLVVLHAISLPPGEFGGPWIERLFTNRLDPAAHPHFAEIAHLRVSAHVLIRRTGALIQFVPFHERAWHAGESCWKGRADCNDFSIGVELEGSDALPFEPVQYVRLVSTMRALQRAYPLLSAGRVAGHCDIAPGRKTDPGPHFDWAHFKRLLADT